MRLITTGLILTLAVASCTAPVPEAVQEFQGVIAKSYDESVEWWAEEVRPPEGAPNVLILLLDDVGFAQIGSFGGLIETPNIDRLAANGLRFNNFHTTALCSPSRASLLAGRYPHNIGCVTVLAERLFAPKGRRAVATGGVRPRRTEPVVLGCCNLPRPGWGEGSVRMAMSLRTSAPAGAVLGVGYSIPRVPLHPACA
jgi:hypothetical protein